MHGVENMVEFQNSLSLLHEWLMRQKRNEDGEEDCDVSHNAQVLQDFLLHNILPHKHRFLVCLRNNRLYMDYRCTSALESQYQKMKKKCSPCLAPNVSLCTLRMVQNQQREAKMDTRKKKAFRMYNSFPNHTLESKTKDRARSILSFCPCILNATLTLGFFLLLTNCELLQELDTTE